MEGFLKNADSLKIWKAVHCQVCRKTRSMLAEKTWSKEWWRQGRSCGHWTRSPRLGGWRRTVFPVVGCLPSGKLQWFVVNQDGVFFTRRSFPTPTFQPFATENPDICHFKSGHLPHPNPDICHFKSGQLPPSFFSFFWRTFLFLLKICFRCYGSIFHKKMKRKKISPEKWPKMTNPPPRAPFFNCHFSELVVQTGEILFHCD